MTALDNLINNTPGLIVHMPLTDTSTAFPPAMTMGSGVTGLVSSWGSAAAVTGSGNGIVAGDTSAMNVAASTNNMYAQIAAATALLPTGDLTAEIFLLVSGLPPSGFGQIMGMATQQNWYLEIGSTGLFRGTIQDQIGSSSGTPASYQPSDIYTDVYPQLCHVVIRRFGDRATLIINGAIAGVKQDMLGATRQTSQALQVGRATGTTLTYRAAHFALYNRALMMGEIRARCDLAGLEPSSLPIPDRSTDRASRAVAAGALAYDAGTGLRLSANSRKIIDAAGNTWSPSTYAAVKPGRATTQIIPSPANPSPGSPTPRAELAIHASRYIIEALDIYTKRRSTNDINFFQNGQWFNSLYTAEGSANTEWRNSIGVGMGAAFLHRYGGDQRGSWLYKIAYDIFEAVIKYRQVPRQIVKNGFVGYNNDTYWGIYHLAPIYLALLPSLDAGTAKRWKESLTQAGEYEWNINQVGGTMYYVNGNVEIGKCHTYWYLYQITGDSKWLTRRETQYDFSHDQASPNPSAPFQDGVSGHPGTFKWVELVAPTQANGSDGSGYFREAQTGVGDDGIAGHPGFDWNYTAYQAALCARDWLDTGDARMLKRANMCWNAVDSLYASSPGAVAGTPRITKNIASAWRGNWNGGTRVVSNGASTPMDTSVPAILAFKSGQSSYATDAATMTRSVGFTLRQNYNGSGEVYREMGDVAGEILRACATDFPDIKIR